MSGQPHWIFEVLSPLAILISAAGAWWFANASITNAKDISRKKSTFDYLSKLSWDRDYIEAKNKFLAIKLGPTKLRAVAEQYERLKSNGTATVDADTPAHVTEAISQHSAIKNILNEYEALAVAIRTKALDEEMMKANIQQQFVEHIDACKEFIEHTRKHASFKNPERIWCELQELAEKWRR